MWTLEKNVTKNAKYINLGIELLPLTLPSKNDRLACLDFVSSPKGVNNYSYELKLCILTS